MLTKVADAYPGAGESFAGKISEGCRAWAMTARLDDGLYGLVEVDHCACCRPVNRGDRAYRQWQRVVEVDS